MATKTISLSLDAYERLRAARQSPKESFSSVLRRARWDDMDPMADGAQILDYYHQCEKKGGNLLIPEADLDRLEERVQSGRTTRSSSRWES